MRGLIRQPLTISAAQPHSRHHPLVHSASSVLNFLADKHQRPCALPHKAKLATGPLPNHRRDTGVIAALPQRRIWTRRALHSLA